MYRLAVTALMMHKDQYRTTQKFHHVQRCSPVCCRDLKTPHAAAIGVKIGPYPTQGRNNDAARTGPVVPRGRSGGVRAGRALRAQHTGEEPPVNMGKKGKPHEAGTPGDAAVMYLGKAHEPVHRGQLSQQAKEGKKQYAYAFVSVYTEEEGNTFIQEVRKLVVEGDPGGQVELQVLSLSTG